MAQVDILNYFSILFWFSILLFSLHHINYSFIIPGVYSIIFTRSIINSIQKKIIKYKYNYFYKHKNNYIYTYKNNLLNLNLIFKIYIYIYMFIINFIFEILNNYQVNLDINQIDLISETYWYKWLKALKTNIMFILIKFILNNYLFIYVTWHKYIDNFLLFILKNPIGAILYKYILSFYIYHSERWKVYNSGYIKKKHRKEHYYKFYDIDFFRGFFLLCSLQLFRKMWERREMYKPGEIFFYIGLYFFSTIGTIRMLGCVITHYEPLVILFSTSFTYLIFVLLVIK